MRRLTRRQRIAAMTLAAVAAAFLTLDLGGGSLRSAHSGVRGSFGALYRGTDGLLGPVRRWAQGVPSAGHNEQQIADLRHQIAQLQGELAARSADRTSSAELARLQLAANSGGYRVLPARVIALGSGDGFDWTVTLDVGTSGGVLVGQTVTDGNGLVGRVLHADRSSSVVLLAADARSGVGVRDTRSGEVGVASGAGTAGYRFVPMNPQARPRVGDALITGPVGATSFVAGISVGTVTAVRTAGDGSVTAQVKPASVVSQLDLVGVILVGGNADVRAPLQPQGSPGDQNGAVAQGGAR